MEICTLGTAKRSAESFFGTLTAADVEVLADTRLRASSQLAGFTQARDLAFFVPRLTAASFAPVPDLAPTKELLDGYRKGVLTWDHYASRYTALLNERRVAESVAWLRSHTRVALLCSEATAEHCHRRLAAEFLADRWDALVRHL